MAKVSEKISESLDEYLTLTGWVKCGPEDVSLSTQVGNISLQYPFMTARMQCVVGSKMAVIAGRNGVLTMIPRSLRDQDKQEILDANNKARLHKGDIEFQENPEFAKPESTLEDVIKLVEKTGHSVIPILDRRSKLYGVYIHNPDNPPLVPPNTSITKIMLPLMDKKTCIGIPYLINQDDPNKVKEILDREEKKFLPMVDENMILQKIAFLQKFDTNYIGIVISTRERWKEEIEKWGYQVDTMCIDSSNACFDDAIKILKYAKQKFPEKPFGIGNIIQARDFEIFGEAGADYIIAGMGIGSICKTGDERGNGRGQFTVAKELAEARDNYKKRYIPLVIDGGIRTLRGIIVALAFGDFLMMGNYFNRFYEAAAQKLDANKQPTSEESLMRYVESWGEGYPRARLVAMYGMNFKEALAKGIQEGSKVINERYGHYSIAAATVEGVLEHVEYRGRLKPCVERDARYIRTTISNAGAWDLKSYRELAVLEKASEKTLEDMKPHGGEVVKEK